MRLSAVLYISTTATLLLFATLVAAQNGDNTPLSGNRSLTQRTRITKQDQQNVEFVIAQLHAPKAADAPLELATIDTLYGQSAKWGTLDKKTADFHINAASVLARYGRLKDEPDLVSISDSAYDRIIANVTGETQLKASSSYCVQLLRQKRFDKALDTMQKVEPTLNDRALDKDVRSRSLYNYGKALELSGRFEPAYKKYELAMKLDPGFTQAVRAAADMARESRSESFGIPQTLAVTDVQLQQLDYESAGANLRAAIQIPHWLSHGRHPQLVRQFVRYLVAARTDPITFRKEQAGFLSSLERNRHLNPYSRKMIKNIRDIYDANLPGVNVIPAGSRGLSDIWKASIDRNMYYGLDSSDAPFAFLSDLISMVGGYYYGQPNLQSRRKSLVCYSHAWTLNTKNLEAGLSLANVLLYSVKNPDTGLDPQDRILDEFINQLFRDKNTQYILRDSRDWERILKCHIVLASIFEHKGQWGPSSNPRTALFQWQLARNALNRLDRSKTATRKLLGPVVNNGLKKAQSQWENW